VALAETQAFPRTLARRRISPRALVGIAIAVLGIVVLVALYRAEQPRQVLVLRLTHDLPAGAVLGARDLQPVAEAIPEDLAATLVPASQQPELLGRRVGAPLSSGEYLTRGQLGHTNRGISPDQRLVWWWLYDGPEVAGALRAEYRQLHQEARRQLADLYAAGDADDELRRAQELYIGLAGELAEDERLWAALFRTHGRRGDRLGLEASIRRLRSALAELAEDDDGPDAIAIPHGLAHLIDELRAQLAGSGRGPASSPPPAG
jgi:hypothetical protein